MRVLGKYPLAVSVEVFGEGADALLLQVVGGRKGKRVKAAGFCVDWPIFQRATLRQSPSNVMSAGESAKCKGVVRSNGHQPVIRQNSRVEELENTMLCRFDSCNVTRQPI